MEHILNIKLPQKCVRITLFDTSLEGSNSNSKVRHLDNDPRRVHSLVTLE